LFQCDRERREKAIAEAQQPDAQLLTDAELLSLHAATNFEQMWQRQRYNMIVFGFRTGLRPSTMEILKCNMLRIRHTDDGETLMEVVIGNMKNLPPDVDKLDAGLYKLQVLQHPMNVMLEPSQGYIIMPLSPKGRKHQAVFFCAYAACLPCESTKVQSYSVAS
jgi:hypothetical protein